MRNSEGESDHGPLRPGDQSFRSMSRMDASLMKASALRLRFSQSLASRRQRLSDRRLKLGVPDRIAGDLAMRGCSLTMPCSSKPCVSTRTPLRP